MYLVKDRRFGMDYYVFTRTNPKNDGYSGTVVEDVRLEYDMNAIHLWPDGAASPDPQLGHDPANPKYFKVFKFPSELEAAHFILVSPTAPIVEYSWRSYTRRFPKLAEVAATLASDEWFDELDQIDEATKLRRRTDSDPEPPIGSGRDQIAEWVAKRHLGADVSIRQVVYLPTGAPANEIRLIEVSERLPGDGPLDPFDFGSKIAGQAVKVYVADVTSDQLAKLKVDSTNLPSGWSLQNAQTWSRRQ